MPKRKAIVTERKILLAFLIKAGDAEAVQAGKPFEGRPITSREQADAEFFAQFVGEELHRFLFGKLVMKMRIRVEVVQLKSRRNSK